MNRTTSPASLGASPGLVALACSLLAGSISPAGAYPFSRVYANSDDNLFDIRESAPRVDGQVHIAAPALMARLADLHANTHLFVLWRQTDFDDLVNEVLPAAERAGVEVWAFLVPPSEANGRLIPPCSEDYVCWADRLGAVAAKHPALTTFIIDDFNHNPGLYSPDYIKQVVDAAHARAPAFRFYAVDYYPDTLFNFIDRDYQGLVTGVVFPHADLDTLAPLPDELARACDLVRKRQTLLKLQVVDGAPSKPGDAATIAVTAKVTAPRSTLSFRLHDDYRGPGVGRFVQLLVGTNVAWQRDLGGGGDWEDHAIDLTQAIGGASTARVAFRIIDTASVASAPVIVRVFGVHGTGLDVPESAWTATVAAGNWSAGQSVLDYKAKCLLLVYASHTSWHAANPTADYVSGAFTIGQDAIAADGADGVVAYRLDKSVTSPMFPIVAGLYEKWNTAVDCGAAVDAAIVDVVDLGADAAHGGGVDGNTGTATAPRSGCSCALGGDGTRAPCWPLPLMAALFLAHRRRGAA